MNDGAQGIRVINLIGKQGCMLIGNRHGVGTSNGIRSLCPALKGGREQ